MKRRTLKIEESGESGFTLVEMWVVIMIIGLIVAFSVFDLENMNRAALRQTVTPTQLEQDLLLARTTAEVTDRPTYVLFNTTSWAQNTKILDGLYVTTNVLPFLSYTVVEYGNPGDEVNQHHWTMVRTWEQLDYPYSFNVNPYLGQQWKTKVETVQPLTIGSMTFPAIGFDYKGELTGYTNSTFVGFSTNSDYEYDTITVDWRRGLPTVEQSPVK